MMTMEGSKCNIEFYCKASCIHNREDLCRLPAANGPVVIGIDGACTKKEESV